jgi:hypothetical protein
MPPYKLLLANPCLDPELRGMTSHLSRTLIPGPSEAKIKLKPVIGNRVWAKQKPLRGEDGFLKTGSPGGTRTPDQLVNSQLLYRLSYRGKEVNSGLCIIRNEAFLDYSIPNSLISSSIFW